MARPKNRRSLLIRTLSLFTVVILALAVNQFREPILAGLGRWLNASDPLRKSDFVMVLPGASETRPFVAAALVRNGWADKVLTPKTVEGPDVADGILPAEDQLLRRILRLRGVREDLLTVLPGASNSTYTDAQALKQFLDQHPKSVVTIVTSDYHVRRSRRVFDRVLGERARQVSFVAAPTDEFSSENWWRCQIGIETYASEYIKWGVYRVQYSSLAERLSAGTVSLLCLGWILRTRIAHAKTDTAAPGENSTG